MTKNDFEKLAAKFSPLDIEWRIQSSGAKQNGGYWARCLAYVDARAIQDRLDLVCGPENWKDDYECLQKGMLCRLSLKVDGEWITKTNGAPETDIEGFKGGISKALVRAASTWGIGRYLYNLDSPWAIIVDQGVEGARRAQTKDKKDFYWVPPSLPAWALPIPVKVDEPKKSPVASVKTDGHHQESDYSPGMQPLCYGCGNGLKTSARNGNYYCPNFNSKRTEHVKPFNPNLLQDYMETHQADALERKLGLNEPA